MTREQQTPSVPSSPREPIAALDPDSDAGREAAEAISEVLAEISLAVQMRKRTATADAA